MDAASVASTVVPFPTTRRRPYPAPSINHWRPPDGVLSTVQRREREEALKRARVRGIQPTMTPELALQVAMLDALDVALHDLGYSKDFMGQVYGRLMPLNGIAHREEVQAAGNLIGRLILQKHCPARH